MLTLIPTTSHSVPVPAKSREAILRFPYRTLSSSWLRLEILYKQINKQTKTVTRHNPGGAAHPLLPQRPPQGAPRDPKKVGYSELLFTNSPRGIVTSFKKLENIPDSTKISYEKLTTGSNCLAVLCNGFMFVDLPLKYIDARIHPRASPLEQHVHVFIPK